MKSFSIKIKELRKQMKWTQDHVAENLNMSVRNYRKLETGETKKMDVDRITQIADLYNVSTEEIYNNDNESLMIQKNENKRLDFGQNDIHVHEEICKVKIEMLERIIEQQNGEIFYLRNLAK